MGKRITEYVSELERTADELRHANMVKSQFLANMSHEMRTPLNAIIGMSEVLLQRTFGDLTPKQERYVNHVLTSGHHLLEIVDIVDEPHPDAAGIVEDFGHVRQRVVFSAKQHQHARPPPMPAEPRFA